MSDEKQHINVNIVDGIKELIIREGDAPKINEPQSIKINGAIEAPASWYLSRSKDSKKLFNKDRSHVIVDKENNTITFHEDATDKLAAVVEGKIKYSADILSFKFFGFPSRDSSPKLYSHLELRSLVKFNERFFEDHDEYVDWIGKLSSFEGKVNNVLKDENNELGKKQKLLEENAESNLPDSFKLKIPIFKNGEEGVFIVELRYEATSGQIKFWLESSELITLQEQEKDKMFESEIAKFDEDITVIYL